MGFDSDSAINAAEASWNEEARSARARAQKPWLNMKMVKRYRHFTLFETKSGYREAYLNIDVEGINGNVK